MADRLERAIEERTDVEREIERGEAEQPSRKKLVRRALWLGITAVSLYLVAPGLLDVLGSARDLGRLDPAWLAAMAALQALALGCLWALQRLALPTEDWYAVITSQLAGNALSKIAPAGGAIGAALQYRMLVQAGLPRGRVVAGLTAVNLLTFAVVLALPVLALPAIARGLVKGTLLEATLIGFGVFAVLLALGAVLLAIDGPLAWLGRMIQRARNRIRTGSEPLRALPARLLHERDRILGTLGPRWKRALLATVGRWAFDYGTLLAALAAVHSLPRPVLVLLAFCAAQILAQIPLTPGGLGFVEAGLTATLVLAAVPAPDWLPLPLGVLGVTLHRRRYGEVRG
jgi:uncharacterized membrane protein YbhN (UPF0104 family)